MKRTRSAVGKRTGRAASDPAPTSALVTLGAAEWFAVGDRDRVERALGLLHATGITELRTGLRWTDWFIPGAPEWFDWLFPRLRKQVGVLPCVWGTPAPLGLAPTPVSPPRHAKAYADFIDVLITRYGEWFDHIELWDRPNHPRGWDRALDPDGSILCDMIAKAAHWVRRCGKKAVLGAMVPPDPAWLDLLGQRGVLQQIDAVGLHLTADDLLSQQTPGQEHIRGIRATLERHGSRAEIWITQAECPTAGHQERLQLAAFLAACRAPAARIYWHRVEDPPPHRAVDPLDATAGIARADGRPKLLARALAAGGVVHAADLLTLHTAAHADSGHPAAALITGGAGFIGANLADRIASEGRPVIVYDNLARQGVERNARFLKEKHGDLVDVRIEDVRNRAALREAVAAAAEVYHFAAQVAVTTSLDDPIEDNEINIGGTIALLEEVRRTRHRPPVFFTSTNKVYGGLPELELSEKATRYLPLDRLARTYGVSEYQPLDFCSPYGCSKGAADQYVLDYCKSYGIPTVVFRMSCIYGPHQCGNEDQGWIAHFLIAAANGEPLTIYGDGKQVRDALYVADLVDAFLLARRNIALISGQAFNMGGGPENAISLLELIELIGQLNGDRPEVVFSDWRTGDQRWYVTDSRAFQAATGWMPRVGVREGVRRLSDWLKEQHGSTIGGRRTIAAVTQ